LQERSLEKKIRKMILNDQKWGKLLFYRIHCKYLKLVKNENTEDISFKKG